LTRSVYGDSYGEFAFIRYLWSMSSCSTFHRLGLT
jgi:hypothetical protein